jgi:diadenosine tetraphosphatase ApaH/serine/threonine PP2A family protein phosphatase
MLAPIVQFELQATHLTKINARRKLITNDGSIGVTVLTAIFADIHSNRQAFSACLAHARDRGAKRIVLLGDYVGYGADPDWTVTTVMDLVDQGALAVLGNHDSAVSNIREQLNVEAQVVIEWTRGELGISQRDFLRGLPLSVEVENRLFVHSEASRPGKWTYVASVQDAARSINATAAHVTFCGHIHRPALYCMSAATKMTSFTPTTGVRVQLLPGRRWLAVLGSVGQPRDGNPAAAYIMLDTDRREITYFRTPYDVEQAAAAIRERGLPTWLAERLFLGK